MFVYAMQDIKSVNKNTSPLERIALLILIVTQGTINMFSHIESLVIESRGNVVLVTQKRKIGKRILNIKCQELSRGPFSAIMRLMGPATINGVINDTKAAKLILRGRSGDPSSEQTMTKIDKYTSPTANRKKIWLGYCITSKPRKCWTSARPASNAVPIDTTLFKRK